jgi:hypothetical protein
MDGWLGSLHRMLGEGHFIGALRLCSWMTAHGMDSLTVATAATTTTTTIARYISVIHQHNGMYDTCLSSWDVPSAFVFSGPSITTPSIDSCYYHHL